MQSQTLRVAVVYVCLVVCCIFATSLSAHSTYGPEPDPVIETEASLISITCPSPSTPSCTDDFVFADLADFEANGGSYNIPSECSVTNFAHLGDDTTSTTGCINTIYRTYQIQTNCGSTFTCIHLVMVTDDMPPVITSCATDVELTIASGCEIAYTPLPVVADDDCGAVTQTNDAPAVFGVGETTVTYTVTDACGNEVQCTASVTVLDGTAPTVTCPSEIATQCAVADADEYMTPQAFIAAGGTISDNCNTNLNDFTITTQNDSSNGGSCPETVTRTYAISDAAGNVATCTQSIVVDDTTAPTFTVPADVANIPCDDVDNLTLAGEPTNVNDNCTTAPTVDYSDMSVAGVGGVVTITRTWSVTDACDNTTTDTQIITTVDNTPPTAVCMMGTVYIGPDGLGTVDPAAIDGGSTDNCSEVTLSITDALAVCNEVGTTIVVELVVEDASGNTSTCEAVVEVLDTITPIITAPSADTLTCTDAIAPPFDNIGDFMLAGGVIDDNCVRDMFFSLQSNETIGSCPTIVTRTYLYQEMDGQMDTAAHIQVILDTIPPALTCPADIVIAETDICDTLLTIVATATDVCGAVTITNDFDNGDETVIASFGGGTTLITYTATDLCNNTSTCVVSVTVAAEPKITLPPFVGFTADGALIDYADFDEFAAAGGSVNAACGLDLSTFDFTAIIDVDGADPCIGTLTETVTIDDGATECTEVRVTPVVDDLPPVLDCSAQTSVFGILNAMTCIADVTFIEPTVTDNFPGTVTLTRNEPDYSVTNSTVTWTAVDVCGNESTCDVQVTILDTSSPIFNIGDTTVMCDEQVPQFGSLAEFLAAPGAEVFDCNLDDASFAFLTDTIFNGNFGKAYVISDIFGNESTVIHFITIGDSTNPTITECTANMAVSTDQGMCTAEVTIPVLQVGDNCAADITVTNDFNNTDNASDTYPIGITTVVWTVADAMGNDTMCTFTVTVTDDEIPEITCPAAASTQCSIDELDILPAFAPADYPELAAFLAAGGLVSDNCRLDSTSFSFSDVIVTAGPCPIIYERTYTVQDSSGNSNSCTQMITVDDTVEPEFDAIMNGEVTEVADGLSCVGLVSYSPPEVTENCMIDSITNDYSNTATLVDVAFPIGTTTVTFTVVDLCGNTGTHMLDVEVLDTTSPAFSIDGTTVMCVEDFPQFNSIEEFLAFSQADPLVSDCQLDSLSFTYVQDTTLVDGTFGKFYTVQDLSGNTSSIIHTLVVDDMTNPMIIACTSDMAISTDAGLCTATVTVPALQVGDNCDADLTITNDFNNTDNASGIYPIGETTVVWTVSDIMGNDTMCTFTVTVTDDEAPAITCPSATATQCSIDDEVAYADIEAFLSAGGTVSDNCKLDSISFGFSDAIVSAGPCPIVYERTYTVQDSSGNMNSCTQTITVQDTIAPVFDSPATDAVAVPSEATTCGAMVTYFVPGVVENCTVDSITNDYTNTQGLVDVMFPVGVTFVNFTVVDLCGNTDVLSLEVTVNDETSPVLVEAVDTVFVNCNPILIDTIETAADVLAAGGEIFDNCGFSVDYVSTIGTDTLTITYEAVDTSGNSLTFTQVIASTDFEGPTFDAQPSPMAAIECGQAFPPQETLTATDGSQPVTIELDTLPFNTDICADRSVTYVWTATDGCGNITEVQATFVINRDSEGPEALQGQTMAIYDNSPGICGKLVSELTIPDFTDNCSGVDTVYTSYGSTTVDVGTIDIDWIAEDSCGNMTTLSQQVTVEDNEAPRLVCDSLVSLNLTDEAANFVFPTPFVELASDNCGVDTIQIRRPAMVCNDPSTTVWSDKVRFCCEEAGDTILVEVRVIDVNGNITECTTTATVSDKLAPTVMKGLPDVTISCGYLLDTLDLSAFGTFVFAEEDRDSIILDEDFYAATDGFVGLDGLAYENCTATVVDSFVTAIDPMCNVGTVTRIFTITDASGNSVMADQTITIEDLTPFNEKGTDILWPPTFEWDQCLNPAPDTSVSGAPVFLNEDQCSMVAATFSDLNFDIGNGGCAYIRRRWKVVDWCQDTTFTYNQDIYVKNVTAPIFADAAIDTTICALGNMCVGQVNLSALATDDCTAANKLKYTYAIDIDSDGTNDLSGSTSSFGRIFNRGSHTVTWTVEDLCGNETSRTDVFTVKECKAPSAVCINGIALSLGNDGIAELWASDINKGSSDNCTATGDLKLSFSNDQDDFGRTFTCDDLGDNTVELWVTDEDGNQSFCATTVEIQDNTNFCSGSKATTVMGNVVTHTGVGIIDSKVSIEGAELLDYHMTDYDGDYAFMDVTSESDVEVHVEKEDTYIRGVNTLDLVKVQRHLLGLESLESPYQLLAADANSDEQISAADLLMIRKLILGVIDELPNTEAWRFVQEGSTSGDDLSPWPFEDELDVNQGSYVTEGDFVGVKIGDVDNSIEALVSRGMGSEARTTAYLGLVSNEQIFTEGQTVTVPLILSKDVDVQALQFTVDYDSSKLRYLGVQSGAVTIADEHTYETDGLLSLAWSEDEAVQVSSGEVVMYVEFEALSHGLLSASATINSSRTAAQAFDNSDQSLEVNLDFINDISLDILLHQNNPNPFFSETVIAFDLPEDMEVQFKVLDGTGRVFWDQTSYYPAGTNSIIINDQLQGKKGIFYLKMDAPEYTSVIKMIKIE